MARSELKWIARATSSLPVPDSPVISTLESVRATFSMMRKTCFDGVAFADDVLEAILLAQLAAQETVFLEQRLLRSSALRTTAFR